MLFQKTAHENDIGRKKMALIKCAECGKEISDKASACIHCGCPISVSTQANASNAGNSPRVLTKEFNAVLYGTDSEKTSQKVFVPELARNVEFDINNNTHVGETIKITLKEGSKYDYILFTAASVYKALHAPAAASANAQTNNTVNPQDFINQMLGSQNQNAPTVTVEAKLANSQTGFTMHSIYVPEFNQTVTVNIPNGMAEGQTYIMGADINSKLNGVNRPLKVHIAKVTRMGATTQATAVPFGIDMAQKIRNLKLRTYIKPTIRLLFVLYFISSVIGFMALTALYPDGGAPTLLMNITSIGFTLGFIPVFCFIFLPYLIGFYPAPGFFKTRKIMKHLESRNLLKKAVVEMETCQSIPFGNKMCLSDNFLYHKRKSGIIIPCDEILWVYGSYAKRKSRGYLMLGTEKWGLQCYSSILGRKQFEQQAPLAIQALQKRNPSVLVGETKENRQRYFQFMKK